jgi:hypothetical protein
MQRMKRIWCCFLLVAMVAVPAVVGHSFQIPAPEVLADGGAPPPPAPPWPGQQIVLPS